MSGLTSRSPPTAETVPSASTFRAHERLLPARLRFDMAGQIIDLIRRNVCQKDESATSDPVDRLRANAAMQMG